MSDNNNTPQTNPEQNADDNTQNSQIQEGQGQETTEEVVETPEPKPEPKAEKPEVKPKPKSSKSKEDNLLYFKNKFQKSEKEKETLEQRLNNLEAETKLTKKTAEVKDVLYNSDINPDFTDLVMDKLLRSDNPAQELQELLEAKPSLKKQAESNKPAGDIGANIGNGKETDNSLVKSTVMDTVASFENNK